eukprot:4870157-Amphidinium_carterae.1
MGTRKLPKTNWGKAHQQLMWNVKRAVIYRSYIPLKIVPFAIICQHQRALAPTLQGVRLGQKFCVPTAHLDIHAGTNTTAFTGPVPKAPMLGLDPLTEVFKSESHDCEVLRPLAAQDLIGQLGKVDSTSSGFLLLCLACGTKALAQIKIDDVGLLIGAIPDTGKHPLYWVIWGLLITVAAWPLGRTPGDLDARRLRPTTR